MIKVIIYTNKSGNKNARLVADLGYRQVILSWDTSICAEILKISVVELLSKDNGSIVVN